MNDDEAKETTDGVVAASADAASADPLLAKYGNDTTDSVQNVRKGCYLAFTIAFVLLAFTIVTIYFLVRWKHATG